MQKCGQILKSCFRKIHIAYMRYRYPSDFPEDDCSEIEDYTNADFGTCDILVIEQSESHKISHLFIIFLNIAVLIYHYMNINEIGSDYICYFQYSLFILSILFSICYLFNMKEKSLSRFERNQDEELGKDEKNKYYLDIAESYSKRYAPLTFRIKPMSKILSISTNFFLKALHSIK